MKKLPCNPRWAKKGLIALAVLALLLIVVQPTSVSSTGLLKLSDQGLYIKAFGYARDNNPVWAAMYLWAYVMREPSIYVKDTNHKQYVDDTVKTLANKIKESINFEKRVRADVKKCNCYPCDQCQYVAGSRGPASVPPAASPIILQPPPDAAIVCEHADFQGKCFILAAGIYNTAEQIGLLNDTISSVMVGSNVRLTLFVHGGLTGESITFDSNDPDLTNDWIDNQYTWNDNATSAQVQWR